MSTANFHSMANFPLWARDFYEECKICPECHLMQDNNNDECDECGHDLSSIESESFFDEWESQCICKNIEEKLETINHDLLFHKIELKSGYYTGVQFYCEIKNQYFDEDKNGELDIDNYDAHYYYDMCRSQARRKYKAEINKINKLLKKIASQYGFDAYGISARFSNGETWYTKIAV